MKRLIGRASMAALAGLLITGINAQAQAPHIAEAVPGEYVVKLKNSFSARTSMQTLSQRLSSYVKSSIPGQNIVVVKRPMMETQENVIAELSQNPEVEIVEPNFIYHINRVPNDPMYGQLWGMNNTGQLDSENTAGTVGVDIGMEKAWDIATGSKDVVVAVIDTGINYKHPDLQDNMWVNEAEANGKPGIDDDNNGVVDDIYGASFVNVTPSGDPMDDHGHGSHCSGVIGAKGNDGKGIVGVNWDVRLMAVKFLDANGSGSLENALRAIDYATKMGAKIISNSWGGNEYSETMKAAIQKTNAAGALFVVAAGNDSSDNDANPSYPASFDIPNILSVAAVDNKGQLASFSNYGHRSVNVAAPGVNIVSSITGANYDSWSGTSMATPHVSGVAALLASHEPTLTNLQLKDRIINTSKPLDGTRGKIHGGLINAYAMLTNAVSLPDANDPVNWQTKDVKFSTAHPYFSNTKQTFILKVDGAQQVAAYFTKFETEKTYDKVEIYNKAGKLVQTISGKGDDSFSQPVAGDTLKVVFTSDDAVNAYGFDITKVAYK